MKAGNLLFSGIQFLFAAVVILLGGFFIGLQHSPHLRFLIARFFADTSLPFSLIGYPLLGCGILLMIGFCAMYRGAYYCVKSVKGDIKVDPVLIKSYLSDYWKKRFPENDFSVDVGIRGGKKLEMFVELPLLSEEKQQAILEEAEVELSTILQKYIGYKRDFTLSVLIK